MQNSLCRTAVIATAFSACSFVSAAQNVPVYGTRNSPNEIYEINTSTGVATLVSVPPISFSVVAAARHPFTNEIWVVGNADDNMIATYDTDTQTETLVNPGTGVQFHRLGFNACGQLYGVPLNTKTVYEIDTETGESTVIGTMTGVGTHGATGDLAFTSGALDRFYYLVGDELYRVDLDLLAAELVGFVPFESTGLSFQPDGTLYGSSKTELWEIDPQTAGSTLIGSFGFGNINDLSGSLPSLFFAMEPDAVAAGEVLTMTAKQGVAATPLALFVTNVDGTPFFDLVFKSSFGLDCEWSLGATVGPGLEGFDVSFAVVGFDKDGKLVLTNSDNVLFE